MEAVSSAGKPVPAGAGAPAPREPDPASRPEQAPPSGTDVTARFEGTPGVVAAARALASGALRDWDCPAGTVEDVVTVVSELVTNAVVHGGGPIGLRVALADPVGGRTVRVEVTDTSTAEVRVLPPSPTRASGRGLRIVQALAARYGVLTTGDGKTVWVELAADPPDGPPPG